MQLGIQMRVAEISILHTTSTLDGLGVNRSRKAVHDQVRKADLQPVRGKSLNQVAIGEPVIRIHDQQF